MNINTIDFSYKNNNHGYDVSLISFISNYLIAEGTYVAEDPADVQMIPIDRLFDTARLYELEHDNSYISASNEDIQWVTEVTNNVITKNSSNFVCKSGNENFYLKYKDDYLINWLKPIINYSYEELIDSIDLNLQNRN